MNYEPQSFESLKGVAGFSDNALDTHFALYQGYVKNVNALLKTLEILRGEDKMGTLEYAELERRFSWEFNGMRLHEYYFASLNKTPGALLSEGLLTKQLISDFGSVEAWEKEFRAIASMRGIGWVVLYYDVSAQRLLNVWVNEHHAGHLAGCVPLLPLDVFEHAFLIDYGTKRAEYIDACMKAIDWSVVEKRFNEMALQ
ncbi:MAG: superoxide dismutase [Candidatus Pacebacteria bacterium]|nr:superoxide dismutase [Candidatus Paceibacterota bacterium]